MFSFKEKFLTTPKVLKPFFVGIISLLLLVLPCSVANSIQKQLDLPLSEKSSPSKSINPSQAHCVFSNLADDISISESSVVHFEGGVEKTITANWLITAISTDSFSLSFRNFIALKVPLYILYQHRRIPSCRMSQTIS